MSLAVSSLSEIIVTAVSCTDLGAVREVAVRNRGAARG
jgi:hypothetical protein